MVLTPDELQGDLYQGYLAANMSQGTALVSRMASTFIST